MRKVTLKNYLTVAFGLFVLLAVNACNPSSNEKKNDASQVEAKELPGNSIYHIDGYWSDQNGDSLQLKAFAGKPVVFTMIFTHCEYACPMMVNDLKKLEALFSPEERQKFHFVMVSFDHVRDLPERLKEYAEAQELGSNWSLLHGNEDLVKELAIATDISFEFVDDGGITHSNRKLVLDKQGVILKSFNGLGTDPELMKSVLEELF